MTASTAAAPDRTFDWDAYGRAVVAGEIPVCKWTRLAVERHYRDLETGHERGLWFSEAHAQHALESFLFLRHSKGEWAGKPFVPSPWQQFWVALAFGWMREDGTRRFREVWEEVPRKNGKSTKLAGIGLYLFFFDGEGGAEVYTAATKMEQARITHDEAVRMVQASPHLRRHIAERRSELFVRGKADKFVPLGRDSKSMDGTNPHGGILDEVHAHPNREIYDVIKSGQGARRQPLIWEITTAGFDLSSFGYEQHCYAKKVLEGTVQDDEFLAIIYTVDDREKWDDPIEWAKANPNLGVSVYLEGLKDQCERAKKQPSEQPNFKTKRLNIWLAGGEAWIPVANWRKCGDKNLTLDDFAGEECWIGIDLAEKSDIAALCLVFKRGKKYFVFFRLYLNEFEVSKQENQHYRRYQERGELIVTDGNATDFDVIRAHLIEFSKKFDLKEVPYDPKFAAYFVTKLVEEGLPMVEIAQTASHFTLPIIEVENLVLTGELQHEGNSAVEWMIGNVLMRESKFTGLKHPTKEKPNEKIDAPVAMLIAMGRALLFADDHIDQGFVEL
jgi:phage terminase large subunit-like protein